MNLTDEQKKAGKENYKEAVKIKRRDFLVELPAVVAAGGAGLGAAYFHYKKVDKPLKIGIIGTGDEGNVLIGALNPDFIDVVAICDIRPFNIHRAFNGDWAKNTMQPARPGLVNVYGKKKGWKNEADARKEVKVYTEGYDELLADDNVEAVIIALPLWLHSAAAIDAMLAGKHVLTEKLMAWNVAQCKEMARVAKETKMLLATGHQRHYSVLYDNAVDTIRQGVIGDIHHIRAQWHRTSDSWRPDVPTTEEYTAKDFDNAVRDVERLQKKTKEISAAEAGIRKRALAAKYPVLSKLRSFNGKMKAAGGKEKLGWQKAIAQLEKLQADGDVPAAAYGYVAKTVEESGYECSALEELIRWRLWNRTGGGLMAELGSHQLDAAGIFISSQFDKGVKVHPLSVVGVGGRHIYEANRDIDDHVYCTFEYPAKGYYKDNDPKKGEIDDDNKKVVVTYSSINGNGYGGYGEVVMGRKGTLILEKESDTYLFGGGGASTSLKIEEDAEVDAYETGGGPVVAVEVHEDVSRGYREEIEHWAWCIQNGEPATTLHCHPKVALADAVIALTTNIAIAENRRIEFDEKWFDPEDNLTPEGLEPRQASAIKRSTFGKPS